MRQLERGEQVQQSSSSSGAAVPGKAGGSVEAPGKTTHQTPGTVDGCTHGRKYSQRHREKQRKEPPYKAARSGDIVLVIDGEIICVPEEDVPKVYYEEDDGQVLPIEQVHEGMQRELQLMKDLEVSERILRTDVPSGKKIWSTRWCHRRKGILWCTRTRGCAYSSLYQHDFGVECSARRLFSGVHEHTFA